MSVWRSFLPQALTVEQREYLLRAVDWARERSRGFEDNWELWRSRMKAGRVSIAAQVYGGAEGLHNALTGGLYLNSSRLPLEPGQCAWALQRWQDGVVVQGLVDVTAVIVHESSHALAGFWGSLKELGPYQRERDFLRELARDEALKARAESRLRDLVRDAWECEKIRLE